MSYAKAMKHHRNIRKCKKQSNMHFGFDSSSIIETPTSRKRLTMVLNIKRWFKERNDSNDVAHTRECIREEIQNFRSTFIEEKAA